MRKLLNTLFVTTQGAYLAKKGDTVVVNHEQQTKLRIPIHTLDSIICFGNVACSPFLMGLCGKHDVTLSFLSENGRFLARVHGPIRGNVLLRREQYRLADNNKICAFIARSIVTAKVANSRNVLLRAARDGRSNKDFTRATQDMRDMLEKLQTCPPLDIIRGIEGQAAQLYFDVFNNLITCNDDSFRMKGRNRRPPLDNVNAMLSFAYTLLVHDIESALESVGLDPAVGFLHRDRPGRPGLALDLMEELRPYLADRLVLSLINRQQVKADGFKTTDSGGVEMDDATRKTILVTWQKRKQDEIKHPFTSEKIAVGLIPYLQAILLARYIRGELEAYPPFFWR